MSGICPLKVDPLSRVPKSTFMACIQRFTWAMDRGSKQRLLLHMNRNIYLFKGIVHQFRNTNCPPWIKIHLYNLAWILSCMVFVCLKNVKMAKPIGPEIVVKTQMTPDKVYGWSKLKILLGNNVDILKMHQFKMKNHWN